MKIHGKIISFGMALLLASCGGKRLPSPAETMATLQELQELATVEYTITKVVKANDNQTWYKFGDRKILITAEATVKGGIDLSALTEKNIIVDGKKISIQLPQPKILSVNLPPQNIKVAFQDVDLFRSQFTSGERDALLAQAEQQIRNSGNELGILEQAKTNTQLFFSNFLIQLGFEEVKLSYDKLPESSFWTR
ncbi:MAG: DUF4230 domain-containing protein [Bacteroidota bacterium]